MQGQTLTFKYRKETDGQAYGQGLVCDWSCWEKMFSSIKMWLIRCVIVYGISVLNWSYVDMAGLMLD